MALLQKVVPNSLNYSDIKPESIDTEIKLVKYVPTATVTGVQQGQMIKFLLAGQGFLDPYSTYFRFKVRCDDLGDGEIRFLDRSAHSFIEKIIIRSQGTELERIEHYDVIAGMVNDMIYSSEQNSIHAWEGFPTQQFPNLGLRPATKINADSQATTQVGPSNQISARYGTGARDISDGRPTLPQRIYASMLLNQGASPLISRFVGETAFTADSMNLVNGSTFGDGANDPYDTIFMKDQAYAQDHNLDGDPANGGPLYDWDVSNPQKSCITPFEWSFHERGRRRLGLFPASGSVPTANMVYNGTQEMEFIIPIYSGLLGVMMPDKKLLPLGLMPLDIEVWFNPYALYSSDAGGKRNYLITEFNLFSHVIYFEQDIHKQLEAQCAEHGIFIYCNSFHGQALQQITTNTVPNVINIQQNFKSINSIHLLFLYNKFINNPAARKLHFVSHNIEKLQLRNGNDLIPQYAIETTNGDVTGGSGSSRRGQYVPYMVELMKAYNKLHDPKTDGAIQSYNFCGDEYGKQYDPLTANLNALTSARQSLQLLLEIINKQANVGRCQYGISLEGEELGTDKMMVTGRKTQYPCQIELRGTKCSVANSLYITFVRADWIVYIRPDLQIVCLGK